MCSLRGVVSCCSEVHESRSGVGMKSFQIVDAKGQDVPCAAFGDSASAESIAANHDIVVYFAQGAQGRPVAENGEIWLYDEATVKVERVGVTPPKMRSEIRISS